ncbi:MAG: sulfatase [Proteobacteria bacterium]|nr:sulfatase [Pseudomonadota bacterium]
MRAPLFPRRLLPAIAACALLVMPAAWSQATIDTAAGPVAASPAAAARPNIVLISLDDLNDWIGPLRGHPQARTPNIDRFAQRAVNFARTYTASPSCNPSRTALLSGRAPYRTGMYSNYQSWRQVLPDEVMLPEYFRKAGYWTGGAGKIFHNNQPDPRSWHEFYPSLTQQMPKYQQPKQDGSVTASMSDDPATPINMPMFENMYTAFDWGPMDVPTEETGDYTSLRWAIDKLDALPTGQPFLLALGVYRPHNPWYVPRKYFDMFPLETVQLPPTLENDLDDIPERGWELAHRGGNYHKHVTESHNERQVVQAYLASIAYADDLFGQMIDAIDASPHAGNTIIVLFSDHGWGFGQKQHWRKFALWENILRTVMMVDVPPGASATLPAGSVRGGRVDSLTSLMDLFPTLTQLAGLPAKPGMDGHSLVPLLADPMAKWDYPAISTYDYNEFSIRSGSLHYIRYIDGSEEFYDLATDPLEWHNRADDPRAAADKARLAAMIPTDAAPLGPLVKLMPHHIPPFASVEEYRAYKARTPREKPAP